MKKYYEVDYDGDYSGIRIMSKAEAHWNDDGEMKLRDGCYLTFQEAKRELVEYFQDRLERQRYNLASAKQLKKSELVEYFQERLERARYYLSQAKKMKKGDAYES